MVGKIENKTNDFAKLARINEKIIRLYKKDFSKYEILVISENRNLFKLFLSDVGLLTSCYSNQVKIAILNKEKSINNGALFENVVAQELLTKGHREYYFNSKKQGELDFVVELDGKAVPLEIKSSKDYKRHSALNNFLKNADYNISEA